MTEMRCDDARERIPELVAGGLSVSEAEGLQRHLAGCDGCRAERELLEVLAAGRPTAPAGTAHRIEAAVRRRRGVVQRPWWGVAAAAVAAVGLGIGMLSDGETPGAEVPAYAAGAGETAVWLVDDGFVAGAPALGALSDEALLTLLDEMGSDPTGGAA